MDQSLAIPLLLASLSLGAAAQNDNGSPANYTFRTDGLYMDGVKSLAELRGKPVFIEYWGTR